MGSKQTREHERKRKVGGGDAQFTAAEKNGKRMALKSFMGAKPFQKACRGLMEHRNGDVRSGTSLLT
jgi:hypothetical protein